MIPSNQLEYKLSDLDSTLILWPNICNTDSDESLGGPMNLAHLVERTPKTTPSGKESAGGVDFAQFKDRLKRFTRKVHVLKSLGNYKIGCVDDRRINEYLQ